MQVSTEGKEKLEKQLMANYDHLHEHAELAWQEVNTTLYRKKELEELGLTTSVFDDCTGVVGIWQGTGESTLCVALRTDMDALHQQVDGEWKANHSCGHDAHMSMTLHALRLLKAIGYEPPGTIKVICQPAEETGEGAKTLFKKGVIDDVDFLYGVHLRPIQEISFGQAAAAIRHGGSSIITGEIHGLSAHGARPHLGINVIEVAAQLVQALKTIKVDPLSPHSIKMTQLSTGEQSPNIIPEFAKFSLDVRAQQNEVLEKLVQDLHKIIAAVEVMTGARIQIQERNRLPAAEVDHEANQIMATAIAHTLGPENMLTDIVTPGGEDFHFYSVLKPELKATMLGLGCDLSPGLHHPHMTFEKKSLIIGSEILARTIVETFKSQTT